MPIYDFKPSIFEANGDGSYTYRWNIKEIEMPSGIVSDDSESGAEGTDTKWECNEVIVWATVTRAKITEAVLISLWRHGDEAKLQNDFNAAKEGVFGDVEGAEAQKYINRYTEFLNKRKAIKEQILSDCAELGII
jgi:hypothetical protein